MQFGNERMNGYATALKIDSSILTKKEFSIVIVYYLEWTPNVITKYF